MIDLWAKSVEPGYYQETYDAKIHTSERLQLLMNSWKQLVDKHFKAVDARNLICYPHNGTHQMIYRKEPFEQIVRRGEIQWMKVGVSSKDAYTIIEIHAKDLLSKEKFEIFLRA